MFYIRKTLTFFQNQKQQTNLARNYKNKWQYIEKTFTMLKSHKIKQKTKT